MQRNSSQFSQLVLERQYIISYPITDGVEYKALLWDTVHT